MVGMTDTLTTQAAPREIEAGRLFGYRSGGDVFSTDGGRTWHEMKENTSELGFVMCWGKRIRKGYAAHRVYRLELTRTQKVLVA